MNALQSVCTLLTDRQAEALRKQPEAEELRLRLGRPPSVVLAGRELPLDCAAVERRDLQRVLEIATGASVHAAAHAMRSACLTYRGLRIGVCGEAVFSGAELTGFRNLSSLAIRMPHEADQSCRKLAERVAENVRNTLILAPPGGGKTTLLRELIRCHAERGRRVCVLDERGELGGRDSCHDLGPCSDVITGLDKLEASMLFLRGMNPEIIAMDEITRPADIRALDCIVGCGVKLLATAHGESLGDMQKRELYRQMLQKGIFIEMICISLREGKRVYERVPL